MCKAEQHLVMCSHFWSRDKDGSHFLSIHMICCSRKLHAACKLHGCMCYRSGVIADRSFTLWNKNFWLSCSHDLILTRWPSSANLTCITCRCTGWVKVNFMCQGFRKLSSDRQTDTTEIIYHAVLRVVI